MWRETLDACSLYYNMSNPNHHSPPGFQVVMGDGLRLRGKTSGEGCKSVHPTVTGYTYSRVGGSIIGYVYTWYTRWLLPFLLS